MFAFIKSIVRLSFNIRRCAISLEKIATLYEVQLNTQDIRILDPKVKDEVEISYAKNQDPFGDPFDDPFEETSY